MRHKTSHKVRVTDFYCGGSVELQDHVSMFATARLCYREVGPLM